MLALALRVYDNDYGSIRFNGMDLKRYAQEYLRACIGVVAWYTINLTTRSATSRSFAGCQGCCSGTLRTAATTQA
jgi:ABC-type transport system involved in Fe-S cluster assembly fused permease/ATPase subunit